jgi:hypothetical protein
MLRRRVPAKSKKARQKSLEGYSQKHGHIHARDAETVAGFNDEAAPTPVETLLDSAGFENHKRPASSE